MSVLQTVATLAQPPLLSTVNQATGGECAAVSDGAAALPAHRLLGGAEASGAVGPAGGASGAIRRAHQRDGVVAEGWSQR